MYRNKYIFKISNNTTHYDRYIIEQLRKDNLIYLIECYRRYNELGIQNGIQVKYIINHTYLYLLDLAKPKIIAEFKTYLQDHFDIFMDFIIFYSKNASNAKKNMLFTYIYLSSVSTNITKSVILLDILDYFKYIILYETTVNINLKTIDNTLLSAIISRNTLDDCIHYINIIFEYPDGKTYFLNWCGLYYNIYRDFICKIHTDTLLDIDIYHRVKKILCILKYIYGVIDKPLLLNYSIMYDDSDYLGYKKYDSAIVSTYNKDIDQLVENTFENHFIFIYHRFIEIVTLLHFSKFIALNRNSRELSQNETELSNITLTIQFLKMQLFGNILDYTFCFYDNLIDTILYTHCNYIDHYKCIPDSFIKAIFELVEYMDKTSEWSDRSLYDYHSYLGNISRLCYLFIEDKDNISNPYLRMTSVKVLRIVSRITNNIPLPVIGSLLDMFIQLEMFNTTDQFYEKFKSREDILDIIKTNIRNIPFRTNFIYCMSHMDNLVVTRLFYIVFNDLNYQIEELFDKINDNHTYINFEHHIHNELKILTVYQSFLCICIKYCHVDRILLDDYIKYKFVHSINYNINLILKTRYSIIKSHPLMVKLLFSFLGIYEHFTDNELFIDSILWDKRTFSFSYLKRVKNLFIKLTIIDNYDSVLGIYHIKYFIHTLLNYSKRISYHVEGVLEKLDPITCEPIKNPVVLPSSKMILDKWTICNHLLSNESDPFNRSPLTIPILEEYNNTNDAKLEIKRFKES